jgi:hypothetical protein
MEGGLGPSLLNNLPLGARRPEATVEAVLQERQEAEDDDERGHRPEWLPGQEVQDLKRGEEIEREATDDVESSNSVPEDVGKLGMAACESLVILGLVGLFGDDHPRHLVLPPRRGTSRSLPRPSRTDLINVREQRENAVHALSATHREGR